MTAPGRFYSGREFFCPAGVSAGFLRFCGPSRFYGVVRRWFCGPSRFYGAAAIARDGAYLTGFLRFSSTGFSAGVFGGGVFRRVFPAGFFDGIFRWAFFGGRHNETPFPDQKRREGRSVCGIDAYGAALGSRSESFLWRSGGFAARGICSGFLPAGFAGRKALIHTGFAGRMP